jgi:hypothetical protein
LYYPSDLSRAHLIPSDSFKLRKLNPSKFYHALQQYYYECMTEEANATGDAGGGKVTLGKKELQKIIRAKGELKLERKGKNEDLKEHFAGNTIK